TLVEDGAPWVAITFPAGDTVLGPEMQQMVVADARDDYGLREARLVSWRVGARGERDAPVEQRLDLSGAPDRAIAQGVLDVRGRGLLPGDAIHYYVKVVDNSPGRQTGVSDTYILRLPGHSELREQVTETTEELIKDAGSLSRSAKELESQTRDLARRSARAARGGSSGQENRSGKVGGSSGGQAGQGGQSSGMEYGALEEARQLLERQEALVSRVEEMRARTEALERAMREAGLQDPALQERLRELKEVYEQILTPDLKDQLAELREALGEMDPAEVQREIGRASCREGVKLREDAVAVS